MINRNNRKKIYKKIIKTFYSIEFPIIILMQIKIIKQKMKISLKL